MTLTHCALCYKMLQIQRQHAPDTVCPVRDSIWCSQCSCMGHLPSECSVVTHIWRPETLEELIPIDVRERWGITTKTRIQWPQDTPPSVIDREISDRNAIDIRYSEGKQDARVREVMRSLKIPTVHKMEGNIQRIRAWALTQGKIVRLLPEK
jgi:hypothetical protein